MHTWVHAVLNCLPQAAKHLSAALRQRAERAGLVLVELDAARPIAEQGRFDAIVHKAVGDASEAQDTVVARRHWQRTGS